MSENDEFKQFLPDAEFEPEQIVYSVPPNDQPLDREKMPSGYDPMGRIKLEGIAFRGLAAGRIPWWVLITGWFVFGIVTFAMLIPAIALFASDLIMLLPTLVISSIPFVILWRGTAAKLSVKKKLK
ncbi:hypothetical protein [Rivularia sp. UHCC 0363]|uniref:hypothetical protein n=1 Tax=Rivularia sp. UHCC 0363 TaxID=3110244 RepID=UPI002B212706|nr:hypothetical protein [Rivularia sp. UHCC 0363]MEA5593144.1 hypothetical protein [Rivularia sp. UHCC 0363]